MSIVDDIKFNILCTKKRLNKKQEEYIGQRIIKKGEGVKWLSNLNRRAITPLLCELAYLTQKTEDGREQVCDWTPLRCIKGITCEEYLVDLIRQNYERFDFLNFEKLREPENKITYCKIMVAYGDRLTDKVNDYKRHTLPTDAQQRQNQVDLGRLELIKDDYAYAREELIKYNEINNKNNNQESVFDKDNKAHNKGKNDEDYEKYLEEQANFILSVAEEVANENNTKIDDDDILNK